MDEREVPTRRTPAISKDPKTHYWDQVRTVRTLLMEQFHPDAFNIGLNDGEAAGQTVIHAHIHVVPRYRGDVSDS